MAEVYVEKQLWQRWPKALTVCRKNCDGAERRRYVPERTCEVEGYDDGVDEGVDGEWYSYSPSTWYLSCGHETYGNTRPCYCSTCGRKVVE